jgi:hypothetical protein
LTLSITMSLIGKRTRFIVTRVRANSDVALEGFKVGLGVDEEKCRSLGRYSPETDFWSNSLSIVSRHCLTLS